MEDERWHEQRACLLVGDGGANRSRVYLFITARRAADGGGGCGRHTYGSTHYFCDFRPRTTNHLTVWLANEKLESLLRRMFLANSDMVSLSARYTDRILKKISAVCDGQGPQLLVCIAAGCSPGRAKVGHRYISVRSYGQDRYIWATCEGTLE